MDAISERVLLIRKVKDGEITKKEVNQEIVRLERTYGDKAFTDFPMEKQPKPWTAAYYKKLQDLGMVGADSKAYVLHLVEVRDEVLRQKRKKYMMIGGAIVAVIGVIAFLIHILLHNQ